MRIFITVLFFIFSFQSWTKADDIRDFQIEGISVGDNLLDQTAILNVTKNVIKNKKYLIYPKSNKFVHMGFKYKSKQSISYLLKRQKFEVMDLCGRSL